MGAGSKRPKARIQILPADTCGQKTACGGRIQMETNGRSNSACDVASRGELKMRWRSRRDREQDLERELRSDLELEANDRREQVLSPEEALHAAQRALGNTTYLAEETREMWGWSSVERFAQDVRLSLRALRRSPGFVLFAVLALALGAMPAIFSVVDAVLLRPLPFRRADRLVEVWEDASHMGFPKATPAPA